MKKIFTGTKGKIIKAVLIAGGITVVGAIVKSLTKDDDETEFDGDQEFETTAEVTDTE